MKIKNIFWFVTWCCLLLACILFIIFPVDIRFLYTWLVNNEHNTEESITEYENTSDTLYVFERMYHKAVLLKFSDTKKSIKIAEHLLEHTALTKSQHISVLILLGELYYIIREYTLASDVYWEVLMMRPENDTVRHNYELMMLFDEIRQHMPAKDVTNDTIVKRPNEIQSNSDDVPHSLQMVQQDGDYFLHIQEQSQKSDLPAW